MSGWFAWAFRAHGVRSWPRTTLCRISGPLRRFQCDEGGAVAVLMAIMIALLLFISAFAIDHSRFTAESVQDVQALDAGLLAAATDFRKHQDKASAIDRAKQVYVANRPDGSKDDLKSVVPDMQAQEVSGTTAFNWKTTLLRAFGYQEQQMRADAKVKYGRLAEVVLVIENSSFTKNEIEVFRTAGLNLKTELMGLSDASPVKMGVVPFAGSVNVGSHNRQAWWIDQQATVPFHRENYRKYLGAGSWTSATETRFQLFDNIGESWAGCAEARSGAYEGNDLPPDPNVAESLFVPMFAPDEPDPGRNNQAPGQQQSYYNDYLEDYPQLDCPKEACIKQTGRGTCLQYALPNFTPKEWQEVSCKYAPGRMPSTTTMTIGAKGNQPGVEFTTGPNFNCTSVPVQPLTRDPALIATTLNNMRALGGSNVAEGILWGYRVLSPHEPFTGGGAFEDGEYEKFMIILARGANWIEAYRDELNHSIYTPWGYGVQDRLNPQSHTQTALTNSMDEQSREACRVAAEKGVQVFAIGYQVSDPQMRALLKYCSVHPSMYFEASTAIELQDHMSTIASKITRLHLTQ